MKINLLAYLIIAMILAGCGNLPQVTSTLTAVAITQTSVETSTPAPMGTSTANPSPNDTLGPLLLQTGDLPDGYVGGQISNSLLPRFLNLPRPNYVIMQEIDKGGEMAGNISLMLYLNGVEGAYQGDIADFTAERKSIDGIGEEAAFIGMGRTGSTNAGDLAFKRCSALAHIYLSNTSDEAVFVNYARRLDARLTPALCK